MGDLIQFKNPTRRRRQSWLSLAVWLPAFFLVAGAMLWQIGSKALVAVAESQVYAQTIAGQASVIDGDTIEIHGTRIWLFGIDAPEGGQTCRVQDKAFPCGRRAAFALADKIGRHEVECRPKDRDRFGRIVAVCLVGGEDINGWMVAQGWALAYRHYSVDYVDQERRAQSAKAGMWQGQFEPPWDWRRRTR